MEGILCVESESRLRQCVDFIGKSATLAFYNLTQAIARVNRVFKDKPGGLVVDYLGVANELKRAIDEYTDSEDRDARP